MSNLWKTWLQSLSRTYINLCRLYADSIHFIINAKSCSQHAYWFCSNVIILFVLLRLIGGDWSIFVVSDLFPDPAVYCGNAAVNTMIWLQTWLISGILMVYLSFLYGLALLNVRKNWKRLHSFNTSCWREYCKIFCLCMDIVQNEYTLMNKF